MVVRAEGRIVRVPMDRLTSDPKLLEIVLRPALGQPPGQPLRGPVEPSEPACCGHASVGSVQTERGFSGVLEEHPAQVPVCFRHETVAGESRDPGLREQLPVDPGLLDEPRETIVFGDQRAATRTRPDQAVDA
jgi:hypothetical protein